MRPRRPRRSDGRERQGVAGCPSVCLKAGRSGEWPFVRPLGGRCLGGCPSDDASAMGAFPLSSRSTAATRNLPIRDRPAQIAGLRYRPLVGLCQLAGSPSWRASTRGQGAGGGAGVPAAPSTQVCRRASAQPARRRLRRHRYRGPEQGRPGLAARGALARSRAEVASLRLEPTSSASRPRAGLIGHVGARRPDPPISTRTTDGPATVDPGRAPRDAALARARRSAGQPLDDGGGRGVRPGALQEHRCASSTAAPFLGADAGSRHKCPLALHPSPRGPRHGAVSCHGIGS
jgi:hypothetical protein